MKRKSTLMILLVTVIAFSVFLIGCSREKMDEFFKPKKMEKESSSIEKKEADRLEKKKEEIKKQLQEHQISEVKKKEADKLEKKKQEIKKQLESEEKGTSSKSAVTSTGKTLLIADFNSGQKPNNLGGNFGAWDKDPQDFTQGAMDSFVSSIKRGEKGFALQISYDVLSPESAYNGLWMKLNGLDASEYNNFNFWIKGDEDRGFTRVFKIEMKNSKGEAGKIHITGVTNEWQRISIPLSEFKQLSDFASLDEFVIVFEDGIATAKEGALYIDNVYLSK